MTLSKATECPGKQMCYYVLDTNVIIEFPDIIPNGNPLTMEEPSVDLTDQCLVVPVTVVCELDKFKNDQNDRGHAAREALRRLDNLTKLVDVPIEDVYNLNHPIFVENGSYSVQVLPVNDNFHKSFSFNPKDDDKDGQIILAALATLCNVNGVPETGKRIWWWQRRRLTDNPVVLLTNDRGMSVRARAHGIKTMRFKYSVPNPYTGRRDLAIPDDVFKQFYSEGRLSNEVWCQAMPKEEPLVANEFLILRPESGIYPEGFDRSRFWHVGQFDIASQEIRRLQHWNRAPETPRNEGQACFNDMLANPNLTGLICTGPAGTGKTYLSTVYAMHACQEGRFDGVVIIPCDPEASSKLGALPGDLDSKMDPTVRPHKNALENYFLSHWGRFAKSAANNPSVTTENPISEEEPFVTEDEVAKESQANEMVTVTVVSETEAEPSATTTQENDGKENVPAKKTRAKSTASAKPLHKKSGDGRREDNKKPLLKRVAEEVDKVWDTWFRNIPVYFARGLSFPGRLVLYDEFQDQNRAQAYALLTRKGEGSKMVITGDIEQIHSAYLDRDNNGLVFARQLLKGHPLVAQITFLPSEVVRDPLVQYIVQNKDSQSA